MLAESYVFPPRQEQKQWLLRERDPGDGLACLFVCSALRSLHRNPSVKWEEESEGCAWFSSNRAKMAAMASLGEQHTPMWCSTSVWKWLKDVAAWGWWWTTIPWVFGGASPSKSITTFTIRLSCECMCECSQNGRGERSLMPAWWRHMGSSSEWLIQSLK